MCGIKIPHQNFALKRQGGGLCARGDIFAGRYGIIENKRGKKNSFHVISSVAHIKIEA